MREKYLDKRTGGGMNIGIIGAGNIGANAARLFADAGHEVAISNSRGPESLASLVEEIGTNARAATVEDAASFGEVVLVAIPFWRYESLPTGPLSGKIVVDAMNYYAGRDGRIAFGYLTPSELLARRLPDARVVKAFNTMYHETLRTGATGPVGTASCSSSRATTRRRRSSYRGS